MSSSLSMVVGLGKTGLSIARYLSRRNEPFIVYDTRENPAGLNDFEREFPNIDIFLKDFPTDYYAQIARIISSPGISLEAPFMREATTRGIPIVSDIDCLVQDIDAPIIAITGTNGKSTVTTLVGEMAKASGLTVAVAGNIGLPVLDILDVGVAYDLWVLELSSFQLELSESIHPLAATILNVTPDHLDRHHSLSAYVMAKQRIYHEADILLYNREDPNTYPEKQSINQRLISFGSDEPEGEAWGLRSHQDKLYLAYKDTLIISVDELHIRGKHNWMNALAACALANTAGVGFEYMKEVLKRFSGLPHRSQWVRTLDGVDWVNDSKGTNVGATVSAISGIGGSMQGKIVLIAGGQAKGADFSELRQPISDYVRAVVLIGQDAPKIEAAIKDTVDIFHTATLEEAVAMAKKQAKPGDVVLLSPACASFDMFRDFNQRGDDFMAAVNHL